MNLQNKLKTINDITQFYKWQNWNSKKLIVRNIDKW